MDENSCSQMSQFGTGFLGCQNWLRIPGDTYPHLRKVSDSLTGASSSSHYTDVLGN